MSMFAIGGTYVLTNKATSTVLDYSVNRKVRGHTVLLCRVHCFTLLVVVCDRILKARAR